MISNEKFFVLLQRLSAIIAVAFGLLTVFSGGQVLLGYSDPGYTVFTPLLIFNTIMGVVYAGAGSMIWRDITLGLPAAKAIFLINCAALLTILIVYYLGGSVAVESLKAMSFRTAVWLVLWVALLWIRR